MADIESSPVLSFNVVWGDASRVPAQAANHFVAQAFADEVLLTIGYVAPPLLVGSPDEQVAAAENLKSVEAMPIARIAMSRGRLRELADLLQRVAAGEPATDENDEDEDEDDEEVGGQ